MYAKHIAIRVFIKPEDDEKIIRGCFKKLLPFEEEEESNKYIKSEIVEGFNNRKIIILRAELVKKKHIRKFIEKLFDSLGEEDLIIIKNQIHTRVDDFCHFFIRLEKDLLQKGIYTITDSGNCFHIDITLPIYPCKKERAIKFIEEVIDKFIKKREVK